MSLYPSLDNAESEEIKKVQSMMSPVCQNVAQPSFVNQQGNRLYPMVEYLGLDLSHYSQQISLKHDENGQLSFPGVKSQVTGGVRQVTLCKDGKGKVGLLVSEVNKGIFVSFVEKNSPAALGGLRFGDQILQLNGTVLAGYSADKVHKMFKKSNVNGINLVVRDRPFERTVTLLKDAAGLVGFEFKDGKITALAKDSSAARNGLVIDHHLLEVQGQNVIGMEDKGIANIIQNCGQTVTFTIVPSFIYEQMTKKIHPDFIKASMDHSISY